MSTIGPIWTIGARFLAAIHRQAADHLQGKITASARPAQSGSTLVLSPRLSRSVFPVLSGSFEVTCNVAILVRLWLCRHGAPTRFSRRRLSNSPTVSRAESWSFLMSAFHPFQTFPSKISQSGSDRRIISNAS